MRTTSKIAHFAARAISLLLLCWLPAVIVLAADNYVPPRNEFGQPDYSGTWKYPSLTFFERPGAFQDLVVSAEQAQPFLSGFLANVENLGDPDTLIGGVNSLMQVRGEYHTSLITIPADGRLPLNEAGRAASDQFETKRELLEGPEALDLDERCIGSIGYPPLSTFIVAIPTKIIQTQDYVLIKTEDPTAARIARISDEHTAVGPRSLAGSATAKWEGDSLVITSSHFREDEIMRLAIPNHYIIGPNAIVTERFTRISESQIHYEFTVDDTQYYSQSWGGELTMSAIPDEFYEYSCHEGNYSMSGILAGGIREKIEAEM